MPIFKCVYYMRGSLPSLPVEHRAWREGSFLSAQGLGASPLLCERAWARLLRQGKSERRPAWPGSLLALLRVIFFFPRRRRGSCRRYGSPLSGRLPQSRPGPYRRRVFRRR